MAKKPGAGGPAQGDKGGGAMSTRRRRQAALLRENLLKRKEQSRRRADRPADTGGPADRDEGG